MSSPETFIPSEAPDEMADVQHKAQERLSAIDEELKAKALMEEDLEMEEPDDVDLKLSEYEPGGETNLPTLTTEVADALHIDLNAADSDQLAVIGEKFIRNVPLDTLRGGREESEIDVSLTE